MTPCEKEVALSHDTTSRGDAAIRRRSISADAAPNIDGYFFHSRYADGRNFARQRDAKAQKPQMRWDGHSDKGISARQSGFADNHLIEKILL